MMGSTITPNSLSFTKEGWIDYGPEVLAPSSAYAPFWWEEINWKFWAEGANRNKHFPVILSLFYVLGIFGLQAFMKNRRPFELKQSLVLWNGSLALFSIVGFARVLPDLWGKVNRPNGLHWALCVKDEISVPMAFWATAFVGSKIIELGDTIFIVLRKRPLQFIQYFHHGIVLISGWICGPFLEPSARFYILMNYGVHVLMYSYFTLSALNFKIPKIFANLITFLQMSQMVAAVVINFYTAYLYYFHSSCFRHPTTILTTSVTYGIFLLLFVDLFYRLVLKKSGTDKVRVD